VAKRYHFPDVTLVGVVDADTMLHMPDFRASERTLQLLAQVAGRSGRADKPGEVLLQTLSPHHSAVAATAAADFSEFARRELGSRKDLGYPPYVVLVRLVWAGKDSESVSRTAAAAAEKLEAELGPLGHRLVGPAPAAVPKVGGKHRFHLLLKVPGPDRLPEALRVVRACPSSSAVRLKVNVDPYDLF
jgi:primosomal protein N' (replication factor Y)